MGILGVLVLAVVWGTIAWHVYYRPKRDGERWVKAAAALGLTLEGRGGGDGVFYNGPDITNRLVGAFGGVPVRVGIRWVLSGGRYKRRIYYTYVEAALPRPLDLALSLSPSSWLGNAFGALVGARDMQVGDPALDAAYEILAASPDEARGLLTMPYVREPLLALSSTTFRPHLSDTVVKLEAHGKCLSADVLYGVIENAVELACRVASARHALGPSRVDRVILEVWGAVAGARGLTLDAGRRTISGRTEGAHVEVCLQQRGTVFTTTFLARFDRALGIGLRLQRQAGMAEIDVVLGGMQDIRTGDATFDRRFIVRGRPEAAVRAALIPEVRARLVQLQERASSLTVEDDHLRADAHWVVTEPEHVHAAISAIAQAAVALSRACERAVPYRS